MSGARDRDTGDAKKKLLIWGASGHARVISEIIRLCGEYEISAFIDDLHPDRHGTEFLGALIYGGGGDLDTLLAAGVRYAMIGFGSCDGRLRIAGLLREKGFEFATAIHPRAVVSAEAEVGAGTVVCAGAVIVTSARVGEHAIVNTGATVDHDCVVGDGAHVSPGVHLAGGVQVGEGAWVGTGSSVIPGVSIGRGSIVGAGSAVVKDIPPGVVAHGVPARVTRELEAAAK